MDGRAETFSMFVVQRTFRTVRRGYDPEEVDEHLERVSRWFTQTDAAKALREERERLEDAKRVAEGARIEEEATLDGARRRADALVREAEERAARELEAARAALREEIEADAERLRAQADEELSAYVERRRREADRLVERSRRAS